MEEFPKKLMLKLKKRAEENALRSLSSAQGLVDFSSNDYLGIARNTSISENTHELLQKTDWKGNSATGSRLLSGNYALLEEVEAYLANYHNTEAALIFNSGYNANLGFFSCVPQRGDVVLYDELIHASIRDGIRMGLAKSYKFKHNDLEDLIRNVSVLAQSGTRDTQFYVVTESVFSMDGDTPDLIALADFCSNNKAHLVVDEAHAIGVFGKGLVIQKALQNRVFAQIITFGKALGCHGAAILGSIQLKQFLINFARSLIYTTALPPHAAATILASYQFLRTEAGQLQIERLQQNIAYFKTIVETFGLEHHFISSSSAIQIAIIKGNNNTRLLADKVQKAGFDVRPILSPTVPKGQERLRFCLHAFNTKKEIEKVLTLIKTHWPS